jgi:hypothetical protein
MLPRSGAEASAPANVLPNWPNGFCFLPIREPSGERPDRARFAVAPASVAAAAPARPNPKACTIDDLFIVFIFHIPSFSI